MVCAMTSSTAIRSVYCLFLTLVALSSSVLMAETRVLRLESIEITGNERTHDEVILRHVRLRPGDVVTPEAIDADWHRLLATDYFSEVDFSSRPGSTRGDVVLVIDVEERSYPSFETGFGYHDLYGWFLTLGGLRFYNMFGTESQLRVGVRLGWRLAGLDAEWSQLLSDDGRYGWGARFYAYGTDQRFYAPVNPDSGQAPVPPVAGQLASPDAAVWSEFQQQISRVGGEISFDVGRRNSARFSVGIRAESIEPDSTFKNVDADAEFSYDESPTSVQNSLGKVAQTGVFLRIVRDTRNTPVYPSTGSFVRLSVVSNNSWMGGDQVFTRLEADGCKLFHIRDGWIFSGRVAGGITSTGTPYYDRFYIGGIYSIRGFANLSLSDTSGDDGYWLTNFELRWPLAGRDPMLPRVIGLVFVDAGQGYERDAIFTYENINVGAGYGLRFRLPWLGTLGFDAGIPLTEPRTNDPFKIYISLGFSF
jgi:outer membrane protein insertion porin family